jgi:hypothetical protein
MKLKKLSLALAITAGAGLAGYGIGYAVWSATGTGAGGAAATVAQPLTVTAITPTGVNASLYPGGPAGPVSFNIANPNPYAITITGLQWGVPVSNSTSTCPNSNISLSTGAPTTVSISIPANSTGSAVVVPGVVQLAHSAPDGCQGMSFSIPVTVTGVEQ